MKITINNTEYKLKYTIRALFIYEQITGKSFKFENLMSEYILFYTTLLANNEVEFTFDELIDLCDENPNVFNQFREWLIKQLEKQAQFISKEEGTDSKKKN